jgi:hypothetical protein
VWPPRRQPEVLCRAAALVLEVASAPATQRNALRLLFRLSKDATNDHLFRAPLLLRRLLAALGGACGQRATQCMPHQCSHNRLLRVCRNSA